MPLAYVYVDVENLDFFSEKDFEKFDLFEEVFIFVCLITCMVLKPISVVRKRKPRPYMKHCSTV